MKPDCKKITQVINYLVSKQGGDNAVPELKVIKLIWAADRYHLRKYARTVTNDNYVAMGKGPVGSSTKDVAEFETGYGNVSDDDIKYSEKYIKFYQSNGDGFLSAISTVDADELSQTDLEALDFALEQFGGMSTSEIIEFTHQYPEWKEHEQKLLRDRKVTPINSLDFFKDPDIKDDPFALPTETLVNSRAIYSEYL